MLKYIVTSDDVREYAKFYAELNKKSMDECISYLDILNNYNYEFGYYGSNGALSFMCRIIEISERLYNSTVEKDKEDLVYWFKVDCIRDLSYSDIIDKSAKAEELQKYLEEYISSEADNMFYFYDHVENYYNDDSCRGEEKEAMRFVLHTMDWYLDEFYRNVLLEDEFKQDILKYVNKMLEIADNLDKNLKRQLEYYQSEKGQEEVERCLALNLKNPLEEITEAIEETEGQVFQNIILDDDLKVIETDESELYRKYCDKEVLGEINEIENER